MIEDLLAQMTDYMKGMQDNIYLIRCSLETCNDRISKLIDVQAKAENRKNIVKTIAKCTSIIAAGAIGCAVVMGLLVKYVF